MENVKLKIALVHDYLSSYGGAEAVLSVFHEMYPEAPIYTIFSDVKSVDSDRLLVVGEKQNSTNLLNEKFKDAKIIPSWFDKIPFRKRLMSPLLWLIPLIWDSFDFSEYDLVISSASWAITKGFANDKTKEICYCHTPPRYLYGYDTSGPWKKYLLVRIYAAICSHFMRLYDFKRAQKVTQFVANSQEVAKRIKKFYKRESVVINPPVDVEKIKDQRSKTKTKPKTLSNDEGKYFLTGGRLVTAKNFDLIIKACNELKIPLKIYGIGPEEITLKSIAGPTIEFLGNVSEEEKFSLMANCRAFIVAGRDEDFGITPVEAMAVGAPVIAYRGGGYVETVIEGKTGVFFDECNVESLMNVFKKIKSMKFKKEMLRKQAKKFDKGEFEGKLLKLVDGLI